MMAESIQTSALLRQVTCPVCLEVMETPKMLPCGHTVCDICLKKIGLYKVTKCPNCRKQITLGSGGVDALPTNYAILDLKESIMPGTSKAPEEKQTEEERKKANQDLNKQNAEVKAFSQGLIKYLFK